MLYTVEDLETGNVRSAVAVNEAAARLQLGDIWTDVERPTAFAPCEIDGLPAIFREAQATEEAALRAMNEASPMGKGRFTTPDALADFTAQEKHRKCQSRREELMRLMIAAGK